MNQRQQLLEEIAVTSDDHIQALLDFLHQLKSKETKELSIDHTEIAREKFKNFAGSISLGYSTGIDNKKIDADLAKVYADEF